MAKQQFLPNEYESFLKKVISKITILFLFVLSILTFVALFTFLFQNHPFLTSQEFSPSFWGYVFYCLEFLYIFFGISAVAISFYLYFICKRMLKKEPIGYIRVLYFILFLFLFPLVLTLSNILPNAFSGFSLGGLLGSSYIFVFKKMGLMNIIYPLAILIVPFSIFCLIYSFAVTWDDFLNFERKFYSNFWKFNNWLVGLFKKKTKKRNFVPDYDTLKEVADETDENKEPLSQTSSKLLDSLTPEKVKASDLSNKAPVKQVFKLPPYELLTAKPSKGNQMDAELIKQIGYNLESFLQTFKINGNVSSYHTGPVVTLFEYKPAAGIKISKITSLTEDIARAMKIDTLRIATLSGTDSIGIELPNLNRQIVYLKSLLDTTVFKKLTYTLPVCLGVDIAGNGVYVQLEKMPHLLIAGRTGSGKSVFMRGVILSLIYKLTPEQCKFILIDPKEVEFIDWKDIPHLLTPIVNDPQQAINSLKWAVAEMDKRYTDMAHMGVKNIEGYNEKIQATKSAGRKLKKKVKKGIDVNTGNIIYEETEIPLNILPYIVIIIDELADLMTTAGKEVEVLIQRLTAKARAAGIHMILATQRPSVDVITGVIKSNLPHRVAFQTISKIDSATILGQSGAEQLLSQGDMLYMEAGKKTVRVHAPFATEKEAVDVANFLRKQEKPNYVEDVVKEQKKDPLMSKMLGSSDSSGSDDDLYEEALEIMRKHQKVSISFIQRHLRIGYNKAASLIERMEEEGIISPSSPTGKREILK